METAAGDVLWGEIGHLLVEAPIGNGEKDRWGQLEFKKLRFDLVGNLKFFKRKATGLKCWSAGWVWKQ